MWFWIERGRGECEGECNGEGGEEAGEKREERRVKGEEELEEMGTVRTGEWIASRLKRKSSTYI